VSGEPLHHTRRQHRPPVLLALASAHGDLATVDVDVLDPQRETFLQPKAGAVNQPLRT
jgi:hypothetical protein